MVGRAVGGYVGLCRYGKSRDGGIHRNENTHPRPTCASAGVGIGWDGMETVAGHRI